MRKIMLWICAGALFLLAPDAVSPLAAQCMGCISSSACGASSARGSCSAYCIGEICTCSDGKCRPGITIAPAGTEAPARFAAHDDAQARQSDGLALLVRDCDGSVELLVYSADGTRLIESRVLVSGPQALPPARLAQTELGSD